MKKTLIQKIDDCVNLRNKIAKENPYLESVWFNITEIDLDELRLVAKVYNEELSFNDIRECMQIHLSSVFTGITMFCHSKKVKVKKVIVIDEAIKNV